MRDVSDLKLSDIVDFLANNVDNQEKITEILEALTPDQLRNMVTYTVSHLSITEDVLLYSLIGLMHLSPCEPLFDLFKVYNTPKVGESGEGSIYKHVFEYYKELKDYIKENGGDVTILEGALTNLESVVEIEDRLQAKHTFKSPTDSDIQKAFDLIRGGKKDD